VTGNNKTAKSFSPYFKISSVTVCFCASRCHSDWQTSACTPCFCGSIARFPFDFRFSKLWFLIRASRAEAPTTVPQNALLQDYLDVQGFSRNFSRFAKILVVIESIWLQRHLN